MRLLLDECLPRETTVSKRWIPERLGMGSVSNVTFCLRSQKKACLSITWTDPYEG